MESSRRSALTLKKPRLADDPGRDRPLPRDPRLRGGTQVAANPRIRPGETEEKEGDAAARRPPQELVSQYRTAISELTFNSKPIITNLTIIAGENQHAAKGIASVICSNILEVPSEQKLPSLYLLDSIVKNIGKDYIKYFAARLPEVFCEAYNQVDPSTHPGMRHLFGTWKGVFPSVPLQIIENDLGFRPMINGFSGATSSKPEPRTTRLPSNSIHVNPKYLEARQRLQQSSKENDTSSDDTCGVVTTDYDADSYDRTDTAPSTRQRRELPIKMHNVHHPHREQLNNPVQEMKGYRDIRKYEFSPELPRQSSVMIVGSISEKLNKRDRLDKPPYYESACTDFEIPVRRKDYDVDHAYGTYRPSGSTVTDRQLPLMNLNNTNKRSRLSPKNWKNSEEEEYMWGDMDPRLADYGGANSTVKGAWNNDDVENPAGMKKGKWMPENLHSQWNKFDTSPFKNTSGREDRLPLSRDIEEHVPQSLVKQEPDSRMNIEATIDPFSLGRALSEHHASSEWPLRESPPSMVGLNNISSRISCQLNPCSGGFSTSSSLSRPVHLSHINPSSRGPSAEPVGMFGQLRQLPLQPPSPSAQSPPSSVSIQHPRSHRSIDHDHLRSSSFSQMDPQPMQLPGQVSRAPHAPIMQPQSQTQQFSTSLLPSQQLPTSSAAAASLAQLRSHLSLMQASQTDLESQAQPQFHLPSQNENPPLGTRSTQVFSGISLSSTPADSSVQSSTSDLLAAILKSGILSNNRDSSTQRTTVLPPLPSGPPPIQVLTSSAPLITPSTSTFPNFGGKASDLMLPPVRTVMPPLPPGPPPVSSFVATTTQAHDTASATPNPFSGLLSSLLAKGIISSPATELPAVNSAKMPNKLLNQSSSFAGSSSVLVPSTSAISIIPSPALKEPNLSVSAPATIESESLIGLSFKPEILREFHPSVINSLFNELMPRCDDCGLRFRLKEQLDKHLNWHDSKKSEISNFNRVSRKWFADSSNWVSGNVGPPCGPVTTVFLEELSPCKEKCEEPMVPADENQSICAFCGEPFQDFYCDLRDEWMYKGTVYLNSAQRPGGTRSNNEITGHGPIVHAICISSSVDEIEFTEHSKPGWTDN